MEKYLVDKQLNKGRGVMVDAASAAKAVASAAIKGDPGSLGITACASNASPGDSPLKIRSAGVLVASLGDGLGMTKRMGQTWRKTIADRQLKDMDFMRSLDQVDCVYVSAQSLF